MRKRGWETTNAPWLDRVLVRQKGGSHLMISQNQGEIRVFPCTKVQFVGSHCGLAFAVRDGNSW